MHAHAHAHALVLVLHRTSRLLSAGACVPIMSFGIDNGPYARSPPDTTTHPHTNTPANTHWQLAKLEAQLGLICACVALDCVLQWSLIVAIKIV